MTSVQSDSGSAAERIDAPEEHGRRFQELQERLENHHGRVHYWRWDRVRMVHSALHRNEKFLIDWIDFSGEDAGSRAMLLMGQSRESKESMNGFWMMLFLHLANFVAMNQTLIDHIRNLMRAYEGTPFATEEELRRKTLADAGSTRFVKDLRNYITHNSTPPLQFSLHFQQGKGTEFSAQLNVATLLEWNNWSAGSRNYMTGRDDLLIASVVNEYGVIREGYYRWFFDQFDRLHGDAVREHDDLVRTQREFMRSAGLSFPNED